MLTTYKNEYTEDLHNGVGNPGIEREMSYMEFPDQLWTKGSDGKQSCGWFHHISVGGYTTSHINSMTKEDEESFKSLLRFLAKEGLTKG